MFVRLDFKSAVSDHTCTQAGRGMRDQSIAAEREGTLLALRELIALDWVEEGNGFAARSARARNRRSQLPAVSLQHY